MQLSFQVVLRCITRKVDICDYLWVSKARIDAQTLEVFDV